MRSHEPSAAWAWLLALSCGVLGLSCNGGDVSADGGSETHFLRGCGQSCAEGLTCACGVCTRPCSQAEACTALAAEAECVALEPRVASGRCAAAEETAYCEVTCLVDADCASLGDAARCEAGSCRHADSPPTLDSSTPPPCEPAEIAASELVILGDSLIELSPFADYLEQAALESGALSEGEHYRSYASALTSFLAEGPFGISTQYTTSRAEGSARVVIMNGGATDMLQNPCAGALSPDCPQVRAAVRGAETLFSRMAADGVEHVVYVSYSDPRNDQALKDGLDTLRPLLHNACGRSPVACHWLDLRPAFEGHDDYLGPDGIVWSDSGARMSATLVWELLELRCIPR
ncbi:MAG TPA: hypothetical protein VKY73_22515 [Polyangiaceae bacterium]|nr:hypothetical protein [Polyangiaceae bacterium]